MVFDVTILSGTGAGVIAASATAAAATVSDAPGATAAFSTGDSTIFCAAISGGCLTLAFGAGVAFGEADHPD